MDLMQPDPANGVFILIVLLIFAVSQVARFFRHKNAKAQATGPATAFSTAGYHAPPKSAPRWAPSAPETITAPQAPWLAYVNDQPDRVPHVAIVGPTGSGKTTLARAILGQRDSRILVITAKEGDDWRGLPYIGIDDDASYTTAERAFQQLDVEVKQRLLAAKRQQNDAPWLTVVLDDYSTLRSVCPAADAPFKLIARLGRALRVRLVVLSDSALVKAWGIEGEGETRTNFAFLHIARGHRVTTTVDDTRYELDTTGVPRLARVSLAARAWHAPQDMREADDVLHGLLLPTNESNERTNERTNGANVPEMAHDERTNERTAIRSRDDVIRLLVAEGWNVTQIREVVRGEAAAIGALVRAARGEG